MMPNGENAIIPTMVLNGLASGEEAWSLCSFVKKENVRIFSCEEQLNFEPERFLEKFEKVILVGWSMGGSGALRLFIENPSKIEALILIAPAVRMMEEKETSWSGMSARRLKAFEAGIEMTGGHAFFGAPEGLPNPYEQIDEETLKRGFAYLRDTDLRSPLEKLAREGLTMKFPVHVFHSEKDGVVRFMNSRYLTEKIFCAAKFSVIPGNQHALPIYIPGAIDEAVSSAMSSDTNKDEVKNENSTF